MDQHRTRDCLERWQAVVAAHGPRTAVTDSATGESWSFLKLDALGRAAPEAPPVLLTAGTGPGFIIDVLRAWRGGSVLLPDDTGAISAPDPTMLPGQTCHLKVTSGSTGARRMAAFTAEQLAADARQIVATMGLHGDQPNVGVISMAHSYGFSSLVLPLLWHGIPLRLAGSPLPQALRAALHGAGPVTLPAVPAMWRAWHQARVDLSAVRTAVSAGAPLPLQLEREIHDQHHGLKIHNFYGCSECGGIAYDATSTPRTASSLVGTAMQGVRFFLRDGCLVVHSAAAGLGWVGGELWDPGTYHTGDLARLDASGQLHLEGRVGETISVAGYKVAPEMVEEALQRAQGVRHCVVFGIPSSDPIRHEEVVACIHHDAAVSLDSIRASLAHLPTACQPRHWTSCPGLHPDERGKISRARWREWWLSQAVRR
jgi:long-chain acyl-CoA synthetase